MPRSSITVGFLFSEHALQAEGARVQEQASALPLALQTRHGPARSTYRDQIVQGYRMAEGAEVAHKADAACDFKTLAKAAKHKRLVGDYLAFYETAIFLKDVKVLQWQVHGPLPVSMEMGVHFVKELPLIIDGGVSKTALRDYMLALNKASVDAAKGNKAARPFTRDHIALQSDDFDRLQRRCGNGKGRIRVSRITATMLGNAEAHMPVLLNHVFDGEGAMRNEPYLGEPLARLLEVERAFLQFFMTGDLSMFYESGLCEFCMFTTLSIVWICRHATQGWSTNKALGVVVQTHGTSITWPCCLRTACMASSACSLACSKWSQTTTWPTAG